jgi:hypothetical protein
MSNEHNRVFSSVVECIRLLEFDILNALGSCVAFFNIIFTCFANLYRGVSFQLTIRYTGFPFLCNFIVPYICGALGFILLSFHLCSLLCSWCYLLCFLYLLLFLCNILQ